MCRKRREDEWDLFLKETLEGLLNAVEASMAFEGRDTSKVFAYGNMCGSVPVIGLKAKDLVQE